MTRVVVATAFGGPEVLSVTEQPLAEPSTGQARVRVHAIGVNPVETKVRSGLFGADPATLPRRLGSEAAGVVTGVGPDTDAVAVGDEVIVFRADGAYAADLVVAVEELTPKPATLTWEQAGALMLTGTTAVHALSATAVADGETVLVHGASGGVGLMAVQLAALRGARVLATASPARHDLLRELGAEPVAYGAGLLDRLRDLAPDGIDAALDLVGTDEALDVSLALVAPERIATIANFSRGPGAGVRVLGGGPGADPGTEVRAAARADLARLADAGSLRVVVAATYPLEDVADAHRLIEEGHTTGKIVLVP
ncbi:MAG: zinc-binding dehydrogenase [Actinobacteria bacterium]|uniref:Unannotated protein n=1 Tax=freshwater metagenome TaxID=449393 RepID=A0A6J6PHZ9_9ZZZZ|nr:zinc-binding dehydrogenase [Actinomycetota bacterium]